MKIFGTGTLYGVPLTDAAGALIANPTPSQIGVLQEAQGELSFDEKLLYGAYQFPVAFGRGKGKFQFKAKAADFSAQDMAGLFFGVDATAGILAVIDNLPASVPGVSTYEITVTPPGAGTFSMNLGVRYASTGIPLSKVASAPAAGQYAQAAGVYTFAAADADADVLISYEYTATSTTQFQVPIANQLMGYAPTFVSEISLPYQGRQMTIRMNNCVSSKFTMPFKNEDFSIQEFDWQCLADAAGNIGTVAIK